MNNSIRFNQRDVVERVPAGTERAGGTCLHADGFGGLGIVGCSSAADVPLDGSSADRIRGTMSGDSCFSSSMSAEASERSSTSRRCAQGRRNGCGHDVYLADFMILPICSKPSYVDGSLSSFETILENTIASNLDKESLSFSLILEEYSA